MADIKDYAIGTLTITLLISLGFNIPSDSTHFCRNLSLAKHCDRISSTGNTCYPYSSVNTGSKFCSSSWEVLAKEPEKSSDSGKVRVRANSGTYECPGGWIGSYTKCLKNDGKQAYLGELI